MKKLLKKQGFTLVELIVVIAIMAIMLAMLIPALSTRQSFEQEARENARAFYSNVQELMIDEKLNGTKLNLDTKTINSEYTLVYAEVSVPSDTTVAKIDKLVLRFADDWAAVRGAYPNAAIETEIPYDTNREFKSGTRFDEFAGSLQKLLSANENEGHYYAVVDKQYRVVYTYYSRYVKLEDLVGVTDFTDDYEVVAGGENNYIGAYPFNLNFEGWNKVPGGNDILPDPSQVD